MASRPRPQRPVSQQGGYNGAVRQPANGPRFNMQAQPPYMPQHQQQQQQQQQYYHQLLQHQQQQIQQQQLVQQETEQIQQRQLVQQQQPQSLVVAEQNVVTEQILQQTVTKQVVNEAACGNQQALPQAASAEVTSESGVPKGTISDEYDLKVRPLIDLVDRLRRIGLDKDVGLPTIVVVGDQSAGKSSVLEAISGVQLPRGSGIVTRCPLELRLKRNSGVEWRSSIKYGDMDTCEDLFSHEEVGDRVEQAQKDLAGETKGITDEMITLEVESPYLPDLTLIDLPGITRVAVAGQKANVAEQIKAMIQRYIVVPESIILAVIPANVDIATSEALKLAENVDKPGDRTIGVITKMDLVDRGGEKQLQKILDNQQYELKKGFVAVKCRSQRDIDQNTNLQQALEAETDFFMLSPYFKEYYENGQCGIEALSQILAAELADHIQTSMPALKANIFQHLQDTRDKVTRMGDGLPKEKSSRIHFLNKMLQAYTDELKKLADGNEDSIELEFRLHKMARDEYEKFAMTIQKSVPQKRGKETNKVYAKFIDQIQATMEEDRGRELPDFMKFSTFKRLVWGVVTQFQGPAMVCMETVINEVQRRLEKLARQVFGKYPKLESKIHSIIASVVHDMKAAGDTATQEMFSMEQLVFSQSQTYTASLDHIRHDKGTDLDSISHGFHDISLHRRREAERMFTRIQAYLEICVLRVADVIPMIIMQHGIIRVIDCLRGKIQEVAYQPTIVDTLEENQDEMRKRHILQERLKRLEAAKIELDLVF